MVIRSQGKDSDTTAKMPVTDYFRLFWKTLLRYLAHPNKVQNDCITSGKVRVLAFYLPQFHPIPENDAWWGEGFTEWTNVMKGKPLYKKHMQPNVPADLGYYNLRNEKTRIKQAELARNAGIEGFVYWHYWFGNGKRLLEGPFREVVDSGTPDFPFCLAWANESWTGKWHGLEDHILVKQEYPGKDDYTEQFNQLQKAFNDQRYCKVKGRLLFLVYKPWQMPEPGIFTNCWQRLATDHGLPGFYFVGVSDTPLPTEFGFDGNICGAPLLPEKTIFPTFIELFVHRLFKINLRCYLRVKNLEGPEVYPYSSFVRHSFCSPLGQTEFPVLIPNWDNTPRVGRNGIVLQGSTPELFAKLIAKSLHLIEKKPTDEKIIFIKSWNEWAEGNYLEPDKKWGRGYLDALKDMLSKSG